MQFKHDAKSDISYIKTAHFPYAFKPKRSYKNSAIIGLGANMGDVIRRFEKLLVFLRRDNLVHVVQSSIIIKNPPFGFIDQDYFHNTVIAVQTNFSALSLLRYLLRVEKRFGRRRHFTNAPRTMDLDVLFFNDQTVDHKKLQLPHPHWHERNSVTIPLHYLGV